MSNPPASLNQKITRKPAMSSPAASRLNTVIGLVSLCTVLVGAVFFIAPLKTIPSDVRGIQQEVRDIGRIQAVQAENLKTVAEIASDTKTIRREVDKHESEIEGVKGRLNRIESGP